MTKALCANAARSTRRVKVPSRKGPFAAHRGPVRLNSLPALLHTCRGMELEYWDALGGVPGQGPTYLTAAITRIWTSESAFGDAEVVSLPGKPVLISGSANSSGNHCICAMVELKQPPKACFRPRRRDVIGLDAIAQWGRERPNEFHFGAVGQTYQQAVTRIQG